METFDTAAAYDPASPPKTLAKVRDEFVAPVIALPSLNHWIVGVGLPVAVRLKITECPALAVVLAAER